MEKKSLFLTKELKKLPKISLVNKIDWSKIDLVLIFAKWRGAKINKKFITSTKN